MWYDIHLGDVLIRRTSTLKTASRVGNLNPVNYGFKTIKGNKTAFDGQREGFIPSAGSQLKALLGFGQSSTAPAYAGLAAA
jgi:hypothetical protein